MSDGESYGKCQNCPEPGVLRYREMPTQREKAKNRPGKVVGVYCLKHAYEYESTVSPWRVLLPLIHRYVDTPPLRLPDGRLYSIVVVHAEKVDPVDTGLVYSPRRGAWRRVQCRSTRAPFRKPIFQDIGAAAGYLFKAASRLPVDVGTITIVVHERPVIRGVHPMRIALRFGPTTV